MSFESPRTLSHASDWEMDVTDNVVDLWKWINKYGERLAEFIFFLVRILTAVDEIYRAMVYALTIEELQVAAGQIASTGIIALSYVQKVSEKVRKLTVEDLPLCFDLSIGNVYHVSHVFHNPSQVSLASDLMYNHMTRDITSSFGYDYILRQVLLVSLHVLGLDFMLLFK